MQHYAVFRSTLPSYHEDGTGLERKENKGATMADKIQRISVNLTPKEDAELRQYADRLQVSCSWVARQAIVQYLEEHVGPQSELPLARTTGGAK